jgi:hypothetical protein
MQTRIAKQVVLLSALLLSSGAHSQTVGNRQGAAAVYSNQSGAINPSALYVDASQFSTTDVCVGIQQAIASVPTMTGTPNGVVIDARNFSLPATQVFLPVP